MEAALEMEAIDHLDLPAVRAAQRQWAAATVASRLRVLRAFRHDLAECATELAQTVPTEVPGQLYRTVADTLCSEVLPLAEACRHLERAAARLLAPVRQPRSLRPVWLGGVSVESHRVPLGVALIIGPGNYPLLLAGAQALQALAAGNAVLWKPAPGGLNAALAMRRILVANGLPPLLLTVLDESAEAARQAIEAGVDKVFLTGSATTGRAVMRSLAETLTPSVMELSGCDAVFVLDGADLDRVARALAFGLRFNGSATCMAPRRLIVAESLYQQLSPHLEAALRALPPVPVPAATRARLGSLMEEAALYGAQVAMNGLRASAELPDAVGPTLVVNAQPTMQIAQADIFAPVLSVLFACSAEAALALHRQCPYALTASVFGPQQDAEALARRMHAGTVLVNDLIVSTADPRASFGGFGQSGFGATRGPQGLLEMTAVKNIIVQRSRSRRPWQPTSHAHVGFFAAFIALIHGRGLGRRIGALRKLIEVAGKLDASAQ